MPRYTLGEDIANSVTHGLGAALSLAGTALLLLRAVHQGSARHLAAFAIFGTSLVLLHVSSTLYHALRAPRARRVFRIFDHCSIYLLIAGTYTPFLLISLWGSWGVTLLVAIWGLAVGGIVFQSVYLGRLRKSTVAVYLLMGWMIVVAAREVWLRVPRDALTLVAVGGLLYTLGVIFYALRRPYTHAIWHLFVLGGSVSHYFAVLMLTR